MAEVSVEALLEAGYSTLDKLRDATESRMRQVSDNGRLAQWVGDPSRRPKD